MGDNQIKYKTPRESQVEMTELVLPSDTNFIGNLLAGKLMHWIDVAGSMAAYRHSNSGVATIAVDSMDFRRPIHKGNVVTLKSKVTWTGTTSMEVKINVYGENYMTGKKELTNVARLIFVALNDEGAKVPVVKIKPETEEEKLEYKQAEKRRQLRIGKSQA